MTGFCVPQRIGMNNDGFHGFLQTSNWPCSACLVAHVDIDWIPGYALISFSSSLPTLCPVQLSFTQLTGLIFFRDLRMLFHQETKRKNFLTIQFLCLFLNDFFPDKSALKLTLLALFQLRPWLQPCHEPPWAQSALAHARMDVVWEKAYRTPPFWGKSMEKTRKKHGICMVCGRFSLESSQWPKLHKNCRA